MKLVNSEKAPSAVGPYSQGWITGGILFTSGQIPIDPETGELVPGGVKEQASQVCRNLGAVLEAAGIDFTHVVKTTCFLSDMSLFGDFNEVYAKYFVTRPARSCVAVKTLPKNVDCEIELIAEI